MPAHLCRRRLLQWLAAGSAVALGGCTRLSAPPLRVAAQPWPGFEMMFLARSRGYLERERVRLIEMPSASASLRSLGAQAIEAAALTLDEVLTARARGLDLRVVAVLDVSRGADAVLARPSVSRPSDIEGMTIGVEASATGAVMLDAMLARLRLPLSAVTVVPTVVDRQLQAYREGRIDAVVTYEPVKSQLLAEGAHVIFSSAEVPGRILDTLAVRADVLAERGDAVRHLLAAHFRALADWRADPGTCLATLAPRLQLRPEQVPQAFAELDLPDAAENRRWLSEGADRLQASARQLATAMRAARLLPVDAPLERLADGGFLPGAES